MEKFSLAVPSYVTLPIRNVWFREVHRGDFQASRGSDIVQLPLSSLSPRVDGTQELKLSRGYTVR